MSVSLQIRFPPSSLSAFVSTPFLVSALLPLSCCTVHRNTELQADQELLQYRKAKEKGTAVSFFFEFCLLVSCHSNTVEQEWRKEATAEAGQRGREESQEPLKPKTNTNPCFYPVPADLKVEEKGRKEVKEESGEERLDNEA